MAKSYKYTFTVLTLITDDLRNKTTKYAESFQESLVIEESGTDGTNPHLNVVIKHPKPIRVNNLNNKFFGFYTNQERTSYLIKTKEVLDEVGLIGGYLQKEHHYKILLNHSYDIKKLKEEYIKTATPKIPIVKTISLLVAPQFIFQTLKLRELEPNITNCNKLYILLLREGYAMHLLNKHWRNIVKHVLAIADPKSDLLFEDLQNNFEDISNTQPPLHQSNGQTKTYFT